MEDLLLATVNTEWGPGTIIGIDTSGEPIYKIEIHKPSQGLVTCDLHRNEFELLVIDPIIEGCVKKRLLEAVRDRQRDELLSRMIELLQALVSLADDTRCEHMLARIQSLGIALGIWI